MVHCYKWSSHLNLRGGLSTIAFLWNQGTDREINDILLTNCCLRLLKCYTKLSPCHTWMTIKNRIPHINEACYCMLWAITRFSTQWGKKHAAGSTETNKQIGQNTWCPHPSTLLMGSLCRRNLKGTYREENDMRKFTSSTMVLVTELLVPDVSECCTAFKGKENLDPSREMNKAKQRCDNLEWRFGMLYGLQV